MITFEQARNLKPGQTIYHVEHKNTDKTPQRWHVNGKVKTWKTEPCRIQIPIKHGMRDYDYITERDLHLIALNESEVK